MYKYNAATHIYAYLPCESLILLFGERRQFKCTFPQPYDISTGHGSTRGQRGSNLNRGNTSALRYTRNSPPWFDSFTPVEAVCYSFCIIVDLEY